MQGGRVRPEAAEAALIAGVHAQTVRAAATRLLSDTALPDEARRLCEAALAATAALSAAVRASRAEALDVLGAAGVSATPVEGPETGDAAQHNTAGLRIARRDLGAAASCLTGAGYAAAAKMTGARVAALARHGTKLTFVWRADAARRLVLCLEGPPAGPLPRVLRPKLQDLAAADLPAGLSPLYVPVRLARLLRERLLGRRAPLADSDQLATPPGLVAPMLGRLGVGEGDVVFDLGCGDGRFLEVAAQRFGCDVVGVEALPDLAAAARARLAPLARSEVRSALVEETDLAGATLVFMFLPDRVRARLLPGVIARAPAGARIVLHEQQALSGGPKPAASHPVFSGDGISVMHVWQGQAIP